MLIARTISKILESCSQEGNPNPDACIWVGLSGGVDSTVLLHALVELISSADYSPRYKYIKAIHIHHGLSINADAWAVQAQDLCIQLSQKYHLTIECWVEKVHLENRSDGLEQAARQARYQVFEKYCQNGDVLLQGHHLDDQVETFFMRAIRGSGLTGLASIPKQRRLSRMNSCQILRPLLTIEKRQLIDYAKKNQLDWVEDESNLDSKIDRNWWRNELLPQIWQRYPEHKQSLSRTLANIQHEQGLLQRLIGEKLVSKTEIQQVDTNIHPALIDIPSFDLAWIEGLDQASSLSYLRAWLAQYVDILPAALQMHSIYVDMIQARVDSEPQIRWSNSALYRYRNSLYLLDLSRLSSTTSEITHVDWQGEEVSCFWGSITCSVQSDTFGLIPDQYRIRCWKTGDVAKPIGRSTRKMKKWWQDYNVPSWARNHWPIIVNKKTNEIAAVPGIFVCQGYGHEKGHLAWVCDYKVSLF